jgi:hypothetical protein
MIVKSEKNSISTVEISTALAMDQLVGIDVKAARLGLPCTTLISQMQKLGITHMPTSSPRSIAKRESARHKIKRYL